METIAEEIQSDNLSVNPNSVKSEDSSPQHGNGRSSPPPNCAICLGTCRNKSFTDSCLHQFCFKCLLTWSKVKAECPLCKQNFKSIIHNVRSNHQYEEYMVGQQDTPERIDIDSLTSNRRFRYRTTLTLPRRETIAIQQLLLHYPLVAGVLPPPRRHRSPNSFRRTVYRHNLWARPLPDFTGRYRDCSPEFYRYNNTQMHRLVPWLNRELLYLLHENVSHISYVMTRILELLPQYHITSAEFREAMQRYFGVRTEHFIHELHCFASTPYDMAGYDRNVQYTTDIRISTMINEVISSSDTDASVDSDIVMVSSSSAAEPPAGPSGVLASQPSGNVIPIETISHSDTDDDSSEVMVVGYIKPPEQRTPEVVDLVGSDSDVVEQEAEQSEPPLSTDTAEHQPTPLVKLMLKRQRSHERHTSESDDNTYRPPTRRRRRLRSRDSATTADTRRSTPGCSSSVGVSTNSSSTWPIFSSTSSSSSKSLPMSSMSSLHSSSNSAEFSPSSWSPTDSDSSYKEEKRKKRTRKISKRKKSKENANLRGSRKKGTTRGKKTRRHDNKETPISQAESDRRSKHKSKSGKGVKSSVRKSESTQEGQTDRAGPSGSSKRNRHKSTREKKDKHVRESKRLRSVVNVTSSYRSTCELSSSASSSNSRVTAEPTGNDGRNTNAATSLRHSLFGQLSSDSDPEDNIPLNLTVKTSSEKKTITNRKT